MFRTTMVPRAHSPAAGIRAWAPHILWTFGYNPFAQLTETDVSTKPAHWTGREEEIALVKGANLNGLNLRYVQAYGAFLVKAHLWRTDLRNAYLSEADLREANLRTADLRFAVLDRASLARAALPEADLAKRRSWTGPICAMRIYRLPCFPKRRFSMPCSTAPISTNRICIRRCCRERA